MQIIKPFLVMGVLCVFISCKKHIEPESIAVQNNQTQAGIPTYPLDWENIQLMPVPPGMGTVDMPWGSFASNQITKEMRDDYHSADGWRLVYNSFNTTQMQNNWYFMLYNVYRGLLRLYYYIPPTANYINSKNIVHVLASGGSYAPSSPLLNFAGREIVDISSNSTVTSTIEQWQVTRSTWYAFQYELAYDQNMHAQNFSTFELQWPIRSTQITEVDLNGNISGTLTGTIAAPGLNLSVTPNINIDKSVSKSTLTINGSSDADKLLPALGSKIISGIKSGLEKGVSGLVSNVLSGLFKKSGNVLDQNVNMKLEAAISLKGTMTSDFLITAPSFAIPGYDQSGTVGYEPAYTEPMGVFYITNKPTIRNTRTVTTETWPDGTRHRYYAYNIHVVPNSYQLYYNPAVLAVASIQNVQVDVVSLDPSLGHDAAVYGDLETLPGYNKVYGNVSGGESLDGPMGFGTLVMRVKFEVVPNNGAPPAVIIKTFAANIENII